MFDESILNGQILNARSLADKTNNYCISLMGSPKIDITEISNTENQFLLPIYQNFLAKFPNFNEGVVHIDPKGYYTPIDDGSYGCATVRRLPFSNQRVIAVADMRHCALFKKDNLAIFFHGVTKTAYGYKFISKKFYIKPIPGISAGTHEILFQSKNSSEYYKEEYDDFDENSRVYMTMKSEYEAKEAVNSETYSQSTRNYNDDE